MENTQDELALEELVATSSYPSAEALLHGMGQRLQYSWDRYTTFIHQTLLLIGGTVLVLLNVLSDKDSLFSQDGSALEARAALGFAGLAMVAGIFWRLTAQYFMDREVLGSPADVRAYFALIDVRSSSDYDRKYYSGRPAHGDGGPDEGNRLYRNVFGWIAHVTVVLLLLSWTSAAVVVLTADAQSARSSDSSTPSPAPSSLP